jgi:hypothetical protein
LMAGHQPMAENSDAVILGHVEGTIDDLSASFQVE